MNKKILLFLLMLMPLMASAQTKRTIHVATAGTLYNLISNDEKFQIEELILTGELNGNDISTIRYMSGITWGYQGDGVVNRDTDGKLKYLDISNVKIVEGGSYLTEQVGPTGWEEDLCTQNNSISKKMFWGTKLETIVLPTSVTSIGESAFPCNSHTCIISKIETPFEIGADVFNNEEIYATALLIVPSGKKSVYQNTAGWSKFQNIVEVGQGGIIGQEFEADGVRYKMGENNTVSVIKRSEGYSGDIIIPEDIEYNGKTYKAIYI